MPRLIIATEKRVYRVSPDDPFSQAALLRALIIGQIVDELTAAPLQAQLHPEVSVDEPGYFTQIKPDGLFCVGGIALHCFSLLAMQPYPVHLTVRAPGYIPLGLSREIPQAPLFPQQLPPLLELGQVPLHREQVLIAGRVMEDSPASNPVAGATVRVTGIWAALPPPNTDPPADPPSFVALRASSYSARDSATATARPVTLAPVAGQDKGLRFGAPARAAVLSLDNRLGLNPGGGEILWIDPGTAAEEFIQTTAVRGASTADQPAAAQLAYSLRNSHRRGAPVTVVTSQNPGPIKSLTRSCIPGDAVLFVSDLTGWDAATAVEIDDGTSTEYHAISHFTATTDQAGFYRLPPISRVARVELAAQGFPGTQTVERSIDYTEPINHVDLHL
jgi:hypothetical protein